MGSFMNPSIPGGVFIFAILLSFFSRKRRSLTSEELAKLHDGKQLLKIYQEHEEEAVLGAIFLKYYWCLVQFAQKHLTNSTNAEDAVANVFFNFTNKERLKKPVNNLLALLKTSVKNECLRMNQAKYVESILFEGDEISKRQVEAWQQISDQMGHEEANSILQKVSKYLNLVGNEKETLELLFKGHHSPSDIANRLNITVQSANATKSMVKKKIKENRDYIEQVFLKKL